MSIVCPNPQCRNQSRERTILPSDANYCLVCGRPVTEKAIEKQNKLLNNAKSRKLNDAKNRILQLESKLVEADKNFLEIEKIRNENSELRTLLNEKAENVSQNNTIVKAEQAKKKEYAPLIITISLLIMITILIISLFKV